MVLKRRTLEKKSLVGLTFVLKNSPYWKMLRQRAEEKSRWSSTNRRETGEAQAWGK